jgi:hypothetical protein
MIHQVEMTALEYWSIVCGRAASRRGPVDAADLVQGLRRSSANIEVVPERLSDS